MLNQAFDAKVQGVVMLFIAIISLWILIIQRRNEKFQERLAVFRLTRMIMENDPNYLIENATEFYKKKFKNDECVDVQGLVYKTCWMNQGTILKPIDTVEFASDEDGTYPYKDILISNSQIGKTFGGFRTELLPFRKFTLVENVFGAAENVKLWNGRTYATSKIENSSGRIKMHIYTGGFYDFYNTCMGFSYELAYYRFIKKIKNFTILFEKSTTFSI